MMMLPHMGGKFDVGRFIKTGHVVECRAYPVPMTPTMITAIENAEREAAELKARLGHGR
jgi:hypothetical protein